MNKNLFVNTHGSEIMTTVLVVVNKKKVEEFKKAYLTILSNHYKNDFENWQKRTKAMI